MRARFLSVYRLRGATSVSPEIEHGIIYKQDHPSFVARATNNPEAALEHIDRKTALAKLILTAFGKSRGISDEAALAEELEAVRERRSATKSAGAYVVFEGATDIPNPVFKLRRQVGGCDFSLDEIDRTPVMDMFSPLVRQVLTALSLNHAEDIDHQIELVGELMYLEDERPIYVFELRGGSVRFSTAAPLSHESVQEVSTQTRALAANEKLTRAVRLFVKSCERGTDRLMSFLTAWSALEIFVNATFRQTYAAQWQALPNPILLPGAPQLRDQELDLNRYPIGHKFSIIAGLLGTPEQEADYQAFMRIKKARDDYFHALEGSQENFPIDDAQKLMRRYLKLHLMYDRPMETTPIIACIGWGSLIWRPEALPVGEWHEDGPMLPVEFVRVSGGGIATLVIEETAQPVQTLWTELNVNTLDEAVLALEVREKVPDADLGIGRWPGAQRNYPGADVISAWAEAKGLSGVVWTTLKCGMDKNSRGTLPTREQLLAHIGTLDDETRARALEYVVKAPAQVQTELRPVLLKALQRDVDSGA